VGSTLPEESVQQFVCLKIVKGVRDGQGEICEDEAAC